jgi:hypothetical protein
LAKPGATEKLERPPEAVRRGMAWWPRDDAPPAPRSRRAWAPILDAVHWIRSAVSTAFLMAGLAVVGAVVALLDALRGRESGERSAGE